MAISCRCCISPSARRSIITLGVFSLIQSGVDILSWPYLLTVVRLLPQRAIVVFDRIRENFRKMRKAKRLSIEQLNYTNIEPITLITSGTTLFVVIALFVQGGATWFTASHFTLLLSITVGTYSSIYVTVSTSYEVGYHFVAKRHLMPPQVEKKVKSLTRCLKPWLNCFDKPKPLGNWQFFTSVFCGWAQEQFNVEVGLHSM